MNNELTNSLFDSIGIINYKGIHVERVIGGWKCFGKMVVTQKELDELIEQNTKALADSLERGNNIKLKGLE